MSIAAPLDRSLIEQIVREIVLAQVGGPPGKPNLVVSVSARHVHLTDQDVETLFGAATTRFTPAARTFSRHGSLMPSSTTRW